MQSIDVLHGLTSVVGLAKWYGVRGLPFVRGLRPFPNQSITTGRSPEAKIKGSIPLFHCSFLAILDG